MSTSGTDTFFDPPRTFVPIDQAARDGTRQLVKSGADYAVAQWTGFYWSYAYGPADDEPDHPEAIDFEPTHYSPKAKVKA